MSRAWEKVGVGKDIVLFRGIVRFWEGWWSDNPSGSRPNFFGRQHLTFDKVGKGVGVGRGIVRKISLMVLMGINPHRLADRIIANIPAFDISHNKAEFSSLSLVCKPPPLF